MILYNKLLHILRESCSNMSLNKIETLLSFPRELANDAKRISNFAFYRGWYLNHIYLQVLNDGDCDDNTFDEKIIQLIDDEIDDYWDYLKEQIPHRAAIWEEIKLCYENKLYHSIIHLCFSQADGLFDEKFGTGLYKYSFTEAKKKFGKSMKDVFDSELLSSQISNFKDGSVLKRIYNEIYLECLNKSTSDLYKKTDYITENNVALPNRHGVIHGTHFKYGTKLNSYKAIAFLQFIFLAVHGEEIGFI